MCVCLCVCVLGGKDSRRKGGWSPAECLQRRCQVVWPTKVENLIVERGDIVVALGDLEGRQRYLTSDTGQFQVMNPMRQGIISECPDITSTHSFVRIEGFDMRT